MGGVGSGKDGEAKRSTVREWQIMFWRTFVDICRNPTLLLLHVLISAVTGVVLGTIFLNVDNRLAGVQNRMGALFFSLAFFGMTSITSVDMLIQTRQVVKRETKAMYHGSLSYFLSAVLLDGLLLRILPALVYSLPLYFMMGLRAGATRYLTFLFILSTFSCTVGVMALGISVLSPSAGVASLLQCMLQLVALLFSGFLVNSGSVPDVVAWIKYVSVYFYAFNAGITNEMQGMRFTFDPPDTPEIPNVKGELILRTLGIQPQYLTRNLAILCGLYAGLLALSYLFVLLTSPRLHAKTLLTGKHNRPHGGQ